MTQGAHRAFTLIELMLVMAIMGLMGTMSVGGYRAMRRGMEERGVMQNVNQFIRNAYQRAMIDRQPTAVYFWNETRRDESDDGTESILVVGRAVAVRRVGRISSKKSNILIDEFGDLRSNAGTDSEGEDYDDKEAKDGLKMFMYRVNGDENGFQRSVVGQATLVSDIALGENAMLSDPDWNENNSDDMKIEAFGYYLEDAGGITWKIGDAYGFEFADLTLPNNYIFESNFKNNVSDPIQTVSKVLRFSPTTGAGGQTISVSAIRPGNSGAPEAQRIGTTETADSQLSKQTE